MATAYTSLEKHLAETLYWEIAKEDENHKSYLQQQNTFKRRKGKQQVKYFQRTTSTSTNMYECMPT